MSSFKTVAFDLPYKGTRDYVHGTDLYNAVMEHLGRIAPQHARGPIRMVIHQFTRNQVDMHYSIGAERCPKPANGRLEFSIANDVSGWLAETDRPVRARRPYPEQEIVAGSRIEDRTIIAGPAGAFSAIEVLVSLTKKLHTSLLPGNAGWAFTRLELQRPLSGDDSDKFRIELQQTLGTRLTKSAIRSGAAALGHIYFSAVQP